jgi:hypothetical protein
MQSNALVNNLTAFSTASTLPVDSLTDFASTYYSMGDAGSLHAALQHTKYDG